MNIRPLTQLREMIAATLHSQTNIGKSFQSFFIETMELFLTHTGRLNFTQMARCGRSCESRFRQNFKKAFDWFSFNRTFLEPARGHRIAIAIDPCYIPKSGKKTPGVDWFWSGCASAMKKGLEILGISIVDADARDSIFLKAEQTFTEKKRGRKPKCTDGMDDPDSLTGWYLRMLASNKRQLLSVCKLIVADAYFSKESFVTGVQRLGFDLVSRFRDDVRLRYLYAGPKLHKRGRPQKYAGRVDLKNLDMSVFSEECITEGKTSFRMYSAVVNAISLERDSRSSLLTMRTLKRSDRCARSSSRQIPACLRKTSLRFTKHVSSWSSSFVMPSSSLVSRTARRETAKHCRLPSTHPSLLSALPGLLHVSRGWTFRWVQPKRCCTTLQWWNDLFPCPENMRT